MDLQAIQQYIESNKDNTEVQAFVQGLNKPTLDGMQKFLNENDDGKKWLESQKHSHFDKSLETWKKNNLEKLVGDELSKRNPQETPEQKQLRELQTQLATMQREKTLEAVKNKAITHATEKKLPLDIVNLIVSDDEKLTFSNLEVLEKVFNTHLQTLVDEKLKQNGMNVNHNSNNPLTLDQIKKMSPEEINKNWETVQKVMASK